jgi:transcription elongation factor GreB
MSKAFTKDDDSGLPPIVPRRAPLPPTVPNYVTARGLSALREELVLLRTEHAATSARGDMPLAVALAERMSELEARLTSAELVPTPQPAPSEARFGATVTVRGDTGAERAYTIVGVDEADAGAGRIAFVAPLARALLGKRAGEAAVVRTPHGDEELQIVSVRYEAPP